MKKLSLVMLSLLLVLAVSAMAQDAVKKPMTFGFKAGLSMANVTGSDADAPTGVDKKMLMGIGGGLAFNYGFTPSIGLGIEALYVMKGVKYEQAPAKMTDKASYIEIPVTLQFSPAMNGSVKPVFFAGPYFGILMSAKEKTEGFEDADDNYDEDIKDYMKSTEFGITFGGGFNYAMQKGAITFDVRYDLGLSKIWKAEEGEVQPNVKTGTIMALLGYKFDI